MKRELYSELLALQDLGLIHVFTSGGGLGARAINSETAIVLGIPPLEAKALFRREDLKILDKVY